MLLLVANTLCWRIERNAVRCMLDLIPSGSDAKIHPSMRNNIYRCAHVRQHGRMTIGIARHHHSNAQAPGLCGKSSQQSPTLQARTGYIRSQGHEMIEKPGVFDDGNRVSFQPDAQHLLISCKLWCCLDAKP